MKVLPKSKKPTRQTQTRSALQARLAKISIIVLSAILILAGRFAYLPWSSDDTDIKGSFLKFKWLSSALYSFGMEVSFIAVGFLLYHASRQMDNSIGKYYAYVSHIIAWIGFFFLGWIFVDDDLFTITVERTLAALIATISMVIVVIIQRGWAGYVESLREIIRILTHSLISEVPPHVKDVDVYYEEVVWPTLDKATDEI